MAQEGSQIWTVVRERSSMEQEMNLEEIENAWDYPNADELDWNDAKSNVDWLIQRVKSLEAEIAKGREQLGNVWVCAFCGQRFPRDDLMGPGRVASHAATCEKSPLVARVKELEDGIRRHRDVLYSDGKSISWGGVQTDRDLYALIEGKPTKEEG